MANKRRISLDVENGAHDYRAPSFLVGVCYEDFSSRCFSRNAFSNVLTAP